MFCTNCGANNPDRANYCQKCGGLLEIEEETRVVLPPKFPLKTEIHNRETDINSREDEPERQIFSVNPTVKFVKVGYAAAAFGALFLVAVFAFFSQLTSIAIPAWLVVCAGLSLLLIPAFYHLKQKTVRYTLTDAKIEIDEGLISKTTRNVPLRSIQDVTVEASIPQRMLGFGNLVIDNAGDNAGGKLVLKNIDAPKKHADALLKQMRRLNR